MSIPNKPNEAIIIIYHAIVDQRGGGWGAGGLFSVTVLGFGLRLYQLAAESLWLDEIYTAQFVTEHSLPWLLLELPRTQPHPPLYYLLLKVWTLVAGSSDWALRFPSAVFGTLTIPALFLVGRRYHSSTGGIVAALLWAVNPFAIYYSQEARMYALLGLLTATSYWLLKRSLDGDGWRGWHILSAGALAGTHVYGLFVIAAQAVYVLARRQRSGGDLVARHAVAVGVLAAPGALVPVVRVLQTFSPALEQARTGTLHQVHHIPVPGVAAFGRTLLFWVAHRPTPTATLVVAVVLPTITLVVAVWGISHADRDTGLAVGSWTAVPVVIAFVASHALWPIYFPRYLIGAAAGFTTAVGIGVAALDHWRVVTVGLLLLAAAVQVPVHYEHTYRKGWQSTADVLAEHDACEEEIAVEQRVTRIALGYYLGDECTFVAADSVEQTDWFVVVGDVNKTTLRRFRHHADNERFYDMPNIVTVYHYE